MRKNRLIILLAAAFIVLVLLNFYFLQKKPLNVQEYEIYFIASEGRILGLDVNNSLLTFGKVPVGQGGRRKLELYNEYNFPVNLKVFVSDNLSDLIFVDPEYDLESYSNRTVLIELHLPKDLSPGNYSGKIRLEMYKA
jgi:hypothetical protein